MIRSDGSYVSAPMPKNILERRAKEASEQGMSLGWWLMPGASLVLAGNLLFFSWNYLHPLFSSGEISREMFLAVFGGLSVLAGVQVFGLFALLPLYFRARAAARLLRFENEMFRLIVEGVNDGVWDWDVREKKIYFSPRWLEMLGLQRGGIGDDPAEWFALIHPEDIGGVEQALSLHFEGRLPFYHAEYRIRTKAGEYKWMLDRGRGTFGKKKEPIRMSGSTTDISRLKEVENVLTGQTRKLELANEETRREKVKIDAMLASIGDGMIATDHEGKVIIMNEQAGVMLNRPISECIGADFIQVVSVEEDDKEEQVSPEARPVSRTLAEGKKVSAVMYYGKQDGSKIPVSVTASPVILAGKILGAIVVFRDITHEREIDKAKTEFVSLASHQLRTPLSAIRWYSEMLISEKLGSLNEEQRAYLKEVYQSNRRMIDLVNALLNVSRIDLGTFAVESKDTDIIEICESVLQELQVKISEKGQTVEKRYEKDFPHVNVDPKLLRIIFQNLLSNSVKYTPEHGVITASISRSGENMRITVSDTGVGIPKENQDKIFTKLFRADNAREVEAEGTGLGLYIVKAIVERSDGRVWFESPVRFEGGEQNTGTAFFVELPLSGMKAIHGAKDLT
ncbi:ATP-binding protein [bacterium]|nr:ATP-binding protein [bacterium]